MGARQGAILQAIVQEFIRSGEPVGSKNLVGRYRLTVSAATVRNDMSRLEELGFLVQPHTSAGRIPTDRGYRFFVDHMQPVAIDEGQKRALDRELAPVQAGIEELLQKASEILSRHTRQAAAVLAPSLSGAKLRHLDLVRLSPRLVLVVIVSDTGRVDKRLVELDDDVAQTELDKVQRELNKTLLDKPLADARAAASAVAAGPRQRRLVDGVASVLDEVFQEESRMYVGGTANLADETAFGELETLHRIIEALEGHTVITRLLSDALDKPTSVTIGTEMPVENLQSCSVVIASYNLEGNPLGSVGVIGPTRMDYTKALAFTTAVARAIQGRFEEISG
jgi:heat-inducible transcriptional repressor